MLQLPLVTLLGASLFACAAVVLQDLLPRRARSSTSRAGLGLAVHPSWCLPMQGIPTAAGGEPWGKTQLKVKKESAPLLHLFRKISITHPLISHPPISNLLVLVSWT